MDDVNDTYNRIRTRAKEISEQRARDEANGGAGVEQIQLHAVDPNTTINIMIPEKDSHDPTVQEARRIFESFPPGLQRALESSNLDEVNKVLGKMSVEEAEQIVQQLGEVCSYPISSTKLSFLVWQIDTPTSYPGRHKLMVFV
jgi:cell division cycle protein 37